MMLNTAEIRNETRAKISQNLISCMAVVLFACLVPNIIYNFSLQSVYTQLNEYSGVFSVENIDKIDAETVAKVVSLMERIYVIFAVAYIINLPLLFCQYKYFSDLSKTPVGVKCSSKLFFSYLNNFKVLFVGGALLFIQTILTIFGIVLLFFPVYLALCLAPFIYADNSDMSVFSAFRESVKLMKGNKMTAFKLLFPYMFLVFISGLLGTIGTIISFVFEAHLLLTISTIYQKLKPVIIQ